MHDEFHITPEPAGRYIGEDGRRHILLVSQTPTYRGFTIAAKRDFDIGFLIDGFLVRAGYIVTDGVCEVMPGAVWFQTVQHAMKAIDDLIASQAMPRGPTGEHPFWALNRLRGAAEARAPELVRMLEAVVEWQGRPEIQETPLGEDVVELLDAVDFNCDMRPTVHHADGSVTKQGPRQTGRYGMPA